MAVSTRTTLRALPRPVWALVGGTFLNRFGGFVYIFLTLYLTRQGYTIPQAGLAIGAYGVGGLGASLLGGKLADHFGRRNTIVLSMCGSAASMLALSQAQGLPPIMLLAGAAGLTAELYRPASSALIADLIPEGQRVTGFALYRLAVNSGAAAGPIVAGFLAGHSFFLLFAGDALTSLLYAGVAVVALPNISAKDHPEPDYPERAAEQTGIKRGGSVSYERGFLAFIAVSALVSFVYMQAFSTLSLQVRAYGLPAAAYGGVISLNGLLIIVAELPLTSLTRRIAPRVTMTVGILLIAVGFSLTAFASSVALLALCVLIWTCGEMVNSPVAQAYVADLAPARLRGRYAGAWSSAWSVGMILGSVIGTTVFAWNAQRFWLLCGALGALAAATLFLTQRDAGPRGQAQPVGSDPSRPSLARAQRPERHAIPEAR